MFENFITAIGFTQSAGQIFLLFIANIFMTIIVLALTHKSDYKVEIAIATFFGLLTLEVLLGWISWLALVLPVLIIIIAWIPTRKSEES